MGSTEFLKLLMNQGGMAAHPEKYARDLLHWTGARVLLASETTSAPEWLQQQVSSLVPTDNLARDVVNWTRYAAVLELLDVSAQSFAANAIKFFVGQAALNREDRTVRVCLLALSMLSSAEATAAAELYDAVRDLPFSDSASEGFLYEPLFLASHGKSLEPQFVELAASLAALLLFKDITGAPHNTAAPAICALAAVARHHHSSAHSLLTGRLEAIDRVSGSFDTPNIKFRSPVFRPDAKSPSVCELRVAANGAGELNTGVYPVEHITWLFGALVANRPDRDNIARPLSDPAGTLRVVLTLSKEIGLPEQSEAFLRLRSGFSWELAAAKLKDIPCRHQFVIERK